MATPSRIALLGTLMLAATPSCAQELLDIGGHLVRVDDATVVLVDGEPLAPGAPLPDKPGLRVEAHYAPSPRGDAAAATLVFSYAVRGAVTSIEPLRVLGQEVTVTADVGMTGVPGGDIANIAVGDHLDVSGYIDTNASLLASFIEYFHEPTPRWLLSGYVSAIDGGIASLGPQQVSLAGVAPIDCGDALDVGEFVEIRADGIEGFGADSVLDTVTRLTCVTPVPLGTPGALGALNGLVGEILSADSFRFGPYVVTHDAATEYRFGSIDDLAPGAMLEVDGVFGEGATFTAQGIAFDAPVIRLEGPVAPADVVPGADGVVTLLANAVRRSAQVRDEDGIFANGITQDRQIELRGYIDSAGNRWATRARVRGGPDATDARVAGPVEAVAEPLLAVLGLTLDASGATFEDPAGEPIDAAAFFAQAVPGAIVEQNGAWDGIDRMSGGVVALILPVDAPPPAGQRSLIVGTLRGGDRVFTDGFDPAAARR